MMRPVGGGPGKIVGHEGDDVGAAAAAAPRWKSDIAAGKPSQAAAAQGWGAAAAEAEAEVEVGAEAEGAKKACANFRPKRRTGPLKSYCRGCGLHYTKCGVKP